MARVSFAAAMLLVVAHSFLAAAADASSDGGNPLTVLWQTWEPEVPHTRCYPKQSTAEAFFPELLEPPPQSDAEWAAIGAPAKQLALAANSAKPCTDAEAFASPPQSLLNRVMAFASATAEPQGDAVCCQAGEKCGQKAGDLRFYQTLILPRLPDDTKCRVEVSGSQGAVQVWAFNRRHAGVVADSARFLTGSCTPTSIDVSAALATGEINRLAVGRVEMSCAPSALKVALRCGDNPAAAAGAGAAASAATAGTAQSRRMLRGAIDLKLTEGAPKLIYHATTLL